MHCEYWKCCLIFVGADTPDRVAPPPDRILDDECVAQCPQHQRKNHQYTKVHDQSCNSCCTNTIIDSSYSSGHCEIVGCLCLRPKH